MVLQLVGTSFWYTRCLRVKQSIKYFQQLQQDTTSMAYILYYTITFRLQQISKVQHESDTAIKTFQKTVHEKENEISTIKDNMNKISKDNTAIKIQLNKLKKLVKQKQDTINAFELEKMSHQFKQRHEPQFPAPNNKNKEYNNNNNN